MWTFISIFTIILVLCLARTLAEKLGLSADSTEEIILFPFRFLEFPSYDKGDWNPIHWTYIHILCPWKKYGEVKSTHSWGCIAFFCHFVVRSTASPNLWIEYNYKVTEKSSAIFVCVKRSYPIIGNQKNEDQSWKTEGRLRQLQIFSLLKLIYLVWGNK